ncbi:hypothetical protein [Streptomyces sp. CA-132043]|uniref:hypothetical protein n=1 Tax=Streptomyces sp. CA-132043 TaxID=3240048 RepID=UPI003D9150D6
MWWGPARSAWPPPTGWPAFASEGYAPRGLDEVDKHGVPRLSLVVSVVVSAVFLLPFPSWYQLVSIISAGLVLSYLMGSAIVPVLRRTAPDLPRARRLPASGFWSAAGFAAGLCIVYAAGFASLVQLLIITFAGLAVHGAYTAPLHGWIAPGTGRTLSAAFLAAWLWISATAAGS